MDKTTVVKVTFGWDNEKLPKSVVLKICQKTEDENCEEQLASKLFRRLAIFCDQFKRGILKQNIFV